MPISASQVSHLSELLTHVFQIQNVYLDFLWFLHDTYIEINL